MIDFKKLEIKDAKKIIDRFDDMSDVEFTQQLKRWASYDLSDSPFDPSYDTFRKELIDVFRESLTASGNKIDYLLDLNVGLKLYTLLDPRKNFPPLLANDDDIWRYISVCVMPDITFIRYPNLQDDVAILQEMIPGLSYAIAVKTEQDSARIKKKRFYSHTRRIWLKTLWWYIHLSWQGSYESTFEVLKGNGTNMISHLIERPGRGYRIDLFRNIMANFAEQEDPNDKLFRAAAKLNRAKCVNVEPILTSGHEAGFSKKLFAEIERSKKKEGLPDEFTG